MTFTLIERDIDLFQLEELHAGSGYAEWFASRIGLEGWSFEGARHSVMSKANGAWGESDILALWRQGDERLAVMIEDKLDAEFTDRQAERYHERGQALVEEGTVQGYATVLVAPSLYLASVDKEAPWTHRLALEELAAWFEGRTDAHAIWRVQALRRALDRLAVLATPSTEEVARSSLELATYLARHYAPALSHNPGRDRSGPIIRFPGSSVNKTLWWKVATRQMTLQLMGPYQGLAAQLDLPFGVGLEPAEKFNRKCDYLVAPVAAVELARPFEEQMGEVEAALEVALKLVALVPRIEEQAASSEASS